jgi:hypothetical protein
MKKLLAVLLLAAAPAAAQFTYPVQPGGGFAGGGAITGAITGATGCTTPPFSFTGDTTSGLCEAAVDILFLQTANIGTDPRYFLQIGDVGVNLGVTNGAGTVTKLQAQDGLVFLQTSGVVRFQMNNSLIYVGLPFTALAGSASLPAYSFDTDPDTGIFQSNTNAVGITAGGTNLLNVSLASGVGLDRTITSAGTTGARTINKIAGTVNFAAAATTLVVTNSLVTTSSIVFCTVRTNDTTATIKNVVPAAGSFTITLTAAATAETSVGFFVTN